MGWWLPLSSFSSAFLWLRHPTGSQFASLSTFISWLTEWAWVLMSVFLCFFVCSADLYMTSPCFLMRFPLPPQSLPVELMPPAMEPSHHAPPRSHVVQKMASLMQEWGSSGLAMVCCWGCCGLGEDTPALCLKPQMALPNVRVPAQLSMTWICTTFPQVPWRERCTYAEQRKKPEWLRIALFQRAVFILNTAQGR